MFVQPYNPNANCLEPHTEQEAARIASAHRSDSAAAQHHLSATKDVILGPLHAGNNHVQLPYHAHQPHQSHQNGGYGGWPQALTLATPYGGVASPSASGADWSSYEAPGKAGYNFWG